MRSAADLRRGRPSPGRPPLRRTPARSATAHPAPRTGDCRRSMPRSAEASPAQSAARAQGKPARVAGVRHLRGRARMADSVYRVTEVIGTSSEGWAEAAANAVEVAAKSVRDLRIAEVVRQDVAIEDGKVKAYRVKLAISFKYESRDE